MVSKSVIILTSVAAIYSLLLSGIPGPWLMLLLSALLGFCAAMIGLNIAHDAVHGAYSSSSRVNRILGVSFNILGANDYVWSIKHNIVHHTYTNIPDHDDDIEQGFLLRMHPGQPRIWLHRFQHWYIFLLYPLATLAWVFVKDYTSFFEKSFGNYKHPRKEVWRLFGFKAINYIITLVIPMIVIPLPWYQIIIGFLVYHFVQGLMLSVIFQLAHVVEGISYPEPDKEGKISRSWAAHQMYTTADFARTNRIVNWFMGGLNFQIEHHLFPRVCHVYYPAIAHIVKRTAEEFNLPYIENHTVTSAIRAHMNILKKLGRPPGNLN